MKFTRCPEAPAGTSGRMAALIFVGMTFCAGSASAMQIFVRSATDQITALEVEPNDTISNLKSKIQDKTGFAPGDQFLYKSGTLLEDDLTLADYNIQKETVLPVQVVDTLPVVVFSAFAGNLEMPVRNAESGPGDGWMTLSYDGPVDLSTMSPGGHAVSLFSYAGTAVGDVDLFDPSQSFSWTFLTSNTGVSGFDPGLFSVDTTHFMNPFTGTFSVVQSDPNSLAVVYSGVPEPSVSLVGAFGLAVLAGRRRRDLRI